MPRVMLMGEKILTVKCDEGFLWVGVGKASFATGMVLSNLLLSKNFDFLKFLGGIFSGITFYQESSKRSYDYSSYRYPEACDGCLDWAGLKGVFEEGLQCVCGENDLYRCKYV